LQQNGGVLEPDTGNLLEDGASSGAGLDSSLPSTHLVCTGNTRILRMGEVVSSEQACAEPGPVAKHPLCNWTVKPSFWSLALLAALAALRSQRWPPQAGGCAASIACRRPA